MRKALVLGILSGINIVIMFTYQWFIVTTLGAGREADAFFASLVIPQLVLSVISGSVVSIIVPILANKSGRDFSRTAWNAFQLSAVIFAAFGSLLTLSASIWTGWIVPGFSEEALQLTISILPAQFLNMFFAAETWIALSANHARQQFYRVELAGIASGMSGLIFLVCTIDMWGIHAGAWGLAGKAAMHMLLISPALGRYHRPSPSDDGVWLALTRIKPLILGNTYYKSGICIDRFLASLAPAGDMSLLHMGNQIQFAGTTILSKCIAAPALPALSVASEKEQWGIFSSITVSRLIAAGCVCCFALLVLLLGGKFIVAFLFSYREFAPDDAYRLWMLTLALGGVGLGGTLGQILSNSFYALGDTVTPTRIGIFGFTVGIAAKVFGFFTAGVFGIALGTSLYYMLNAILLSYFLYRKLLPKKAGHP